MNTKTSAGDQYDVIIVGGSFAGLAAAMALGRSMRKILVIDAGEPCNRKTPQAHNLITHDGRPPHEIAGLAKKDLVKYKTVHFFDGFATEIKKEQQEFVVSVNDSTFTSKKILLANGVKDVLPELPGFSECWGISVIHCPYCHGFEYKDEPTAILANGETAFELSKMVRHWAGKLTIVTNGKTALTEEQQIQLSNVGIDLIEKSVERLDHSNGRLDAVVFADGSRLGIAAAYARPEMRQHTDLALQLGCAMNDHLVSIDEFQRTTVAGVYAAGDNSYMMRSLAASIAAGTKAGALIDREMIMEQFASDAIGAEKLALSH